MNDVEHISPRYSLFVKGVSIKKDFKSRGKTVYALRLFLITDDKDETGWHQKSFEIKKEIGLLGVWEYATTTLMTYEAIKKALDMIDSLHMQNEHVRLFFHDPITGKHLIPKKTTGKTQKVSRIYDYYDEAKEVIQRLGKYKRLKCCHVPKTSNAPVDGIISDEGQKLL